nr:flagellar biosynthetic protein FliR [uncultured Limnobacter sp.]
MNEILAATPDPVRHFTAVLVQYLPRVLAFMVFFPLFNKGYSSRLIKSAVGASLVLYPVFAVTSTQGHTVNPAAMTVLAVIAEIMLGSMLGMIVAMPYMVFRTLGAFVDVYRGATFAAAVAPGESSEELPLETMFGYLFVALILAGPGLHAITSQLLGSYLVFPPGSLDLLRLGSWWPDLLRLFANFILFGFLLSCPVLVAVLAVEIIIEIISAFAQQLQVYNLQFGMRSIFGVAALLVVLHFAEDEIFQVYREYSTQLNTMLETLE